MTLSFLQPISSLWKPKKHAPPRVRHLMLAGINEQAFVNQWGPPDIRFNLDRLEGSYQYRSAPWSPHRDEGAPLSVWVYSKQDRIFFFVNQKLVSHFKWSEFKEKRSKAAEKTLWSARSMRKPSTGMAYALSSVA